MLPVIHEGVVDQTLPTNSSSGLFKVNTHDNQQILLCIFGILDQEVS